ncbi:MAG: multi-sensor hybrid histidine [Geobacteraceae bacterium]|nr:MAG: multi-sensor hybrid histidine [Geobacteraceae bacterium]
MLRKDSQWRLSPLNISLLYTLIGVLWILLPNQFLSVMSNEPKVFRRLENLNQGLFIIVTAWALHFFICHSEAAVRRRQESLRRVNRALKAFTECNHTLIRAADELEMMNRICETIVKIGGYRLAWVGIAENDEGKTVHPVAQYGDEGGYLETLKVSWDDTENGRGPTGMAIRTAMTSVAQHILTDPRWEPWRDRALRYGFASAISLPLISDGQVFGALVILSGEPGAFDRDEMKLLEELAENLSFGVTTLRMNTERKKAEKEKKLLASVVEQAMEGIILFDSDGTIQYVNPAVERITGYAPSEMIGQNSRALGGEEQNREFYEAIWNTLFRGEGRTCNYIYNVKDNSLYEIDSTIWAVSDIPGNVSNYAALIRDVTREVQLERQLRLAQKMEAIATLAGGIAHDFNNNLAAIITCTEMARDDVPEGSPVRELLDVVLKAGYRGRNLVKQILTISCQGEQERQLVQVELIVEECLKLLRASFPASIEIRQHFSDRLGVVLADPTQIHQIIVNLCTNAAYAVREKGGVLEISVANVDLDADAASDFQDLQAGNYLRLTVKDTGHGMTPEVMERIFDPFFTTKGKSGGTGLGLSVIHGIVKNHGGAITVDSKPGEGATFHVYLPRIDSSREVAKGESPILAPKGSERILFVDDEEDVAFAGQKMLERFGYEVVVKNGSQEALELFRDDPNRFDLVFTDQTMPGMTGTELIKEIHCIRPDIPVILCTGLGPAASGAISQEEKKTMGIRELVLKPLDQSEMARIIRRVLDKKQ